jgi:hypothetical protein
MQIFRDNTGQEWSVEVTVATARRLRARGVDVFKVIEADGIFAKLSADPAEACLVLFEVVRPQAESLKVSEEDFLNRIGGESLHAATLALIGAIVDFFPNPAVRGALRRMLQEIGAEVDRRAEKLAEIVSTLGESSPSLPGSQESTHPP